ncbi:trigger factor [Merdimmobilis hominis]|uniref:Trigger factor n=1 Tax=uncultured Anaerotruncus sp. TaxID=905011 RepID=A0A6N2SDB4_9FIRM|nr:trigger factor [Merdimmobilis hominis]PWL59095.1 MAG: trigger factor [Oscillospiraceae bacterium]
MSLTASKKIDTNLMELEISVPAEEFKAAVDRSYRKNAPSITIPGFRKGKAPRHMIEKMYGEGVFFEDAVNELYPSAYEAAAKEAGITPVDRADIEILEVGKDGFSFKATVTVKPEVEVEGYKGIEAEKVEYTVTDEDVDAEIAKLQKRAGTTISVEDRPAQMGDNVVFDFEGFIDGVAFEGGKGEEFPLTLGSNQFIPGFEEQIAGHAIGEDFDVNVSFPENYHVDELKGKPAVFKCKIHQIKAVELPELDDEFAKDVSEFETLEALKADLKSKLQEKKDLEANDEFENKLVDAVIAGMKADIPACMYERKIDEMVQDFAYRLQMQGLNLETYMQYTGSTVESFRETFKEQAEHQVKVRLALEKIAELENLTATEEDLEEQFKKAAEVYGMELEKIKELLPADEISKDIAVNKAIDFVRENAVAPKAKKKTTRKSTAKKAKVEEEAAE